MSSHRGILKQWTDTPEILAEAALRRERHLAPVRHDQTDLVPLDVHRTFAETAASISSQGES